MLIAFPLFFLTPSFFCPTFFKTRSLALIAGECCKFSPSGFGQNPAAKRINFVYCPLLCLTGEVNQDSHYLINLQQNRDLFP